VLVTVAIVSDPKDFQVGKHLQDALGHGARDACMGLMVDSNEVGAGIRLYKLLLYPVGAILPSIAIRSKRKGCCDHLTRS
jgi:hypothetical protein